MRTLLLVSVVLLGAGCIPSIKEVEPAPIQLDQHMSDVSKEQLVAGWEVQLSNTDGFESIILDGSDTYVTYQNERPLDNGTWIFDGEKLMLKSSTNSAMNVSYHNLEMKDHGYLLLDRTDIEGQNGERTWQKVTSK